MKDKYILIKSGFAMVLGAWLQTGLSEPGIPDRGIEERQYVLDPLSDPSKPSNKQLLESVPMPGDRAKEGTLKLPGKPAEGPVDESDKEARVLVKKIVFQGNKTFSDEDLSEVTNPYLNRRLSGSDLEQLRYQLTLFYVDKGYISSGAVIENQSFKDGTLNVKIVEGQLSDVQVSGNGWLREEYIRDRLMGDPDEPLNTHDLQQRYTRLLNDPMIDRLNGTLLPGANPGEAVLDLKVTRRRNYGLVLSADNFSPPSIGGYTGRIDTWVSNLSSFGETINFSFNTLSGAQNYYAGIDIPLTAQGTRFAFHYTNSNTVLIEQPFTALNIASNIISYDAQLLHPFILDTNQILTIGFNFNIRQDVTTLDGRDLNRPGSTNGQNQETVVRLWQDYIYQERNLALNLRSTESIGVDVLGANKTTLVGDGRFFNWILQAAGRYSFPTTGAYISLSGALQLSDDQLLPLEKLAIGGFFTVKGYRQNYLVRDQGFYTTLEAHLPIFWGQTGLPYGIYLVPFLNYGGAWDYKQSGTNLFSTGIGIDGQYNWVGIDGASESLSASLYWANRLTDYKLTTGTPYDLQDNGVNFQMRLQVF